MIERDQLTLSYLNNQDRIKLLEQKYDDEIITGNEKIRKILDRG